MRQFILLYILISFGLVDPILGSRSYLDAVSSWYIINHYITFIAFIYWGGSTIQQYEDKIMKVINKHWKH